MFPVYQFGEKNKVEKDGWGLFCGQLQQREPLKSISIS